MNHIQDPKRADASFTFWQIQLRQAAETPWLAAIMLNRARRLQQRLAYFYQELTGLPRRWRRRLQKLLAAGLVGAALMLAFGPTPSVHAASITVDPAGAGTGTAANGYCSLVEAIINANDDAATYADCDPGNGADTIYLNGGTYSYTTTYGTGTALPDITTDITIEGSGAVIQRSGGENFRVMRVNSGGSLTLNNATITGGSNVPGGGIAVYGGSLTVNDSTIRANNLVLGGGGGVANYNGTVAINSSTVSGNSAFMGGGILNRSLTGAATLTLTNSTVSGNTANENGGGIANYDGTVTLNNSTITGNAATNNDGGGIYNRLAAFGGSATANLNRSIVSGNSAAMGDEIDNNSGIINANNYNVLGHSGLPNAQAFNGFSPCSGGGCTDISATNNGTNPTALGNILDTTLADNGGPTFTHALVGASPAIDTIATTDPNCNPGSTLDQRGAARANGLGQGGSACDSGAYELSAETPTAITLQNISTNGGTAESGLIAALLGGLAAVSLAFYRRFKPNT